MKTNLDIPDDILRAAAEVGRRDGKSVDEVISELCRDALTAGRHFHAVFDPENGHGFRPFASRGGVVTNEMIDALREGDPH